MLDFFATVPSSHRAITIALPVSLRGFKVVPVRVGKEDKPMP